EAHPFAALDAADQQEQERQYNEHDERHNRAAHDDVLKTDACSRRRTSERRTQRRTHDLCGHTLVLSPLLEAFYARPGANRQPHPPAADPMRGLAGPHGRGVGSRGFILALTPRRAWRDLFASLPSQTDRA